MTEHLTEDTAVSDPTTDQSPDSEAMDTAALDTGAADTEAVSAPHPTEDAVNDGGVLTDGASTDDVAGQTPQDAGATREASTSGSGRESGGSRRQHLEREGEVAADFLETLLDICDLDGDIDVDIDGDRAAISVVDSEDGRVPRRLVGQDGNVLEALQEVTRLAVQSATGERSRLMLDVAGHRAERRRVLVEVASKAIGEVNESGERQALDPMTAFERKVVHDEVLAAGLVSESEGSEPRRYVVILPA